MIRINLIPGHKKQGFGKSSAGESRAVAYLGVMGVGWLCIAGAGYWILGSVEQETEALRQESRAHKSRAEEIRKLIDEEALLARQKKVKDIRNAITSVKKQRRSPVFMMHELAKVLSTGKMPDINEEQQRRLENSDPQSRLNPGWDASSVWLDKLAVVGGSTLKVSGTAHDPADLDEFLKRMRSSVRFSHVTHPKFDVSSQSRAGQNQQRTYDFHFDAQVAFWD